MAELHLSEAQIPDLGGQVAVVTGGSSGIGYATAQILSRKGCFVHLLDVNQPESTLPPNATYHVCDVTSWPSLRDTFEKIGRLDMVFANAGIVTNEALFFDDEVDEDGKLREPDYNIMEVNYKSVVNTVKLGMSQMKRSGCGGRIVVTSSLAAYTPQGTMPLYSSTKTAVIGLVRALRGLLPAEGITINGVAPSPTVTKIIPQEFASKLEQGGLPVSKADHVALAMAYAATARESRRVEAYGKDKDADMEGDRSWNGRVIVPVGEMWFEVEEGLADRKEGWFGKELCQVGRTMQKGSDKR